MPTTVVVLGGSLGGLAVTHRLLKYSLSRDPGLRVVLVSKNSHFYWNLASVYAVIPGVVGHDQLLQPIAPGLAHYPADSVEFVVDAAAKQVTVRAVAEDSDSDAVVTDNSQRLIAYDYLVVATGADAADADMPWKAAGFYAQLVASMQRTAHSIAAAAGHVIVGGGGATGVELAAEIKHEFPARTVILLNAGDRLVAGDAATAAVEVRHRARVLGVDQPSSVDTDVGNHKTHVLADGANLATDLYLPTTGLIPNATFLPAESHSNRGYAQVDDCHRLRAVPDAWALGDVVSKPQAGFLFTDAQAAGVAKNIDLVLHGKAQRAVKEPPVDAFICSIGRGRGAGRLGPVPIPSFVWAFKGRSLHIWPFHTRILSTLCWAASCTEKPGADHGIVLMILLPL